MEKILADHEALPDDWPVHGDTGYRFANLLTGVFVDAAAEIALRPRLPALHAASARTSRKSRAMSRMPDHGTTLAAELDHAGERLARIAAGNRATRDYTRSGLRKALAEIAARFPVYRSYVTARGVSETDRRYIAWAVRAAKRASRIADPACSISCRAC